MLSLLLYLVVGENVVFLEYAHRDTCPIPQLHLHGQMCVAITGALHGNFPGLES